MIPSRTPDGQFHVCPVCGNELCVDPSTVPTRDAPCPCCGHLLDFDKAPHLCDSRLWDSQSYEELLVSAGEHHLGIISVELATQLHQVLEDLADADRLPPRDQSLRWLADSSHWSQLINRLEGWQPAGRRGSWLKTARDFLTRRRRRPRERV